MNPHVVINGLIFQACWFLALLVSWQAGLIALAILLVHGLQYEPKARSYLGLAGIVGVGVLFDFSWVQLSWITFVDENRLNLLGFPVWLMVSWLAFCLTLDSSLSWLTKKRALFPWLCMVLGPVSYSAGERLGVIEIHGLGLFALAFEWLVVGKLVVLNLARYERIKENYGAVEAEARSS